MTVGCTPVFGQARSQRNNEVHDQACRSLLGRSISSSAQSKAVAFEAMRCDVSGPEALIQAWRSEPTDTGIVSDIAIASAQLPDDRLAKALESLVRNRLTQPLIRRAALGVLGAYVTGRTLPFIVESPKVDGGFEVILSTSSHTSSYLVDQPLSAQAKGQIAALLRSLARQPEEAMDIRSSAASIMVTASIPPS
jgi:hypothetical protein